MSDIPADSAITDPEAIRRDIETLDDRLHDLLRERAELAARLAATLPPTRGTRFLRPGREAATMQRLLARHAGQMPAATLARVYREITGGLYHLQAPLHVAVLAPEKSVGYWDLARNHFGSTIEMSLHRTAPVVLRGVTTQPGTVGVLPLPPEGDAEPWWDSIAVEAAALGEGLPPRVVARLPGLADPPGRFEELTSYVIATAMPEPSGQDLSLVVATISDQMSRGTLSGKLARAGLEGQIIAVREDGRGSHLLFEIRSFVAEQDPRLAQALADSGGALHRLISIGSYACLPPG